MDDKMAALNLISQSPQEHHQTDAGAHVAQPTGGSGTLISGLFENFSITTPEPGATHSSKNSELEVSPSSKNSSGLGANKGNPVDSHSDDDDKEIETHVFGDDMSATLPGELTQTLSMVTWTLSLLLSRHRHLQAATTASHAESLHIQAGISGTGGPSRNPKKRRRVGPGPLDTSEQEPSHDVEHDQDSETPLADHVLLACPFWKGNEATWKHCFRYKLKRIRDVKLHLRRVHARSFCVRCGGEFEGRQTLDAHYAFTPPCATRSFLRKWLSEDQKESLAKRSNPKFTIEQQWYAIWDIVYPGRPRPDSPYADQSLSERSELISRVLPDRGTWGAAGSWMAWAREPRK
jgi:hypothetical protein